MSGQPRGHRNGKPNNQSGNVWGEKNSQNRQQSNQNQQRPTNFADSDAFGPPLGGRARKNAPSGKQASRDPQPTKSHGQQNPSASRPQPSVLQSTTQASAPSAWGQTASSRGPQPQAKQQPKQQPQPSESRQQPLAPQSSSFQANVPSAWGQTTKSANVPPTTGDASGTSSSMNKPDERNSGGETRGKIGGDKSAKKEEKLIVTKQEGVTKQAKFDPKCHQRSFVVKSNYFKLNSALKFEIFHYHLDFSPPVENPAFRNALLQREREKIGIFLYDRGSSIFTIREFYQADKKNKSHQIVTRDREENEIALNFTRVGIISTLEFQYLQVLNIIHKRALTKLKLTRVQRDYFDPAAKYTIPQHGIELWPGYTTSIRQHEQNILMNSEIRFKLMRTETVFQMLQQAYTKNRNNWKKIFESDVTGIVVLTEYNNKTYRVSDVLFEMTPTSTFETNNGPISYVDYYNRKHGIKITDLTQPLLRCKPTEKDMRGAQGRGEELQPVNLVPELCYPTGYTDEMRKNFNLMKDVAQFTRVGPSQRVQRLLEFGQRLKNTPESMAVFKDWGLQLQDLVTAPALQMKWESIILGENRNVPATNAAWANALQGVNSMYFTEKLENYQWAVVIPESLRRDAESFVDMLQQVSRGMKFDLGIPEKFIIQDDRITTLNTVLEKICLKNPKMVFVAVSNNQADRYSAIKKVCTVRHAVPSQVVTRRVMDMRNMSKTRSVATKVAIQMNTKIGGIPWNVNHPLDNVMFIGYDVCHDTRDKSRSYGALVATLDMKTSNHYYSAVSAHQNGEELSNNLSAHVTMALRRYKEERGMLPTRIFFYRDGVGEGQTNYVYEHELKYLLETLGKIYKEQTVKMAFIIVAKRINTKFFEERGNSGAMNVPPGTVVSDVVTLPERYDFFLVSQAVNQGTATPTNYHVLHDTTGLPADKLQIMTYKLCHLYYNWAGTTRVPAVCQYAHKLAFLVGNYLHCAPRDELSPYLYFL